MRHGRLGIHTEIGNFSMQKDIFRPTAALFFSIKLQAVEQVGPFEVERHPIGAGQHPAIAELRDLVTEAFHPLSAVLVRDAQQDHSASHQILPRAQENPSAVLKPVIPFA